MGAESRPIITVEPVVVMPDIASKNASVGLRPRSAKASGIAAKEVSTSQLAVVRMKAWRIENRLVSMWLVRMSVMLMNRVTPLAIAKTFQSGLPTTASAIMGTHIATARVVSKMPFTKSMGR